MRDVRSSLLTDVGSNYQKKSMPIERHSARISELKRRRKRVDARTIGLLMHRLFCIVKHSEFNRLDC
jgi:hypothetical protein